MIQVPSLSPRSISVHTFLAPRIEETVWENQRSNLLFWERTVVWSCCSWSACSWHSWWCIATKSISQASHLAQDRSANVWWPRFRFLAFSPPGGSRSLFSRFPFSMGKTRHARYGSMPGIAIRCASPWRGFSVEGGRPHDTLWCFFTSLWLGQGQSIFSQVQQTKISDLTCFKTLPTKSVTCSQVGPMSLKWPGAPLGGFDQSSLSPSHEDPNDGHLEDALPALPLLYWRRDALKPPELQRGCLDRYTGVQILEGGLRRVTWNRRGHVGSPFLHKFGSARKHNYFSLHTRSNDIICLQEIHGKDEFLHALQIFAPRLQVHGTFIPNNAIAGGSAVCICKYLLPDDAVVTHVVTCQGRDTLWTYGQSLVIVNVLLEPELTLRGLRGRLRLVTPHWPRYPDAIGVIMEDFNICEPEEGRFNVWNQTFTGGDKEKAALFSLRCRNRPAWLYKQRLFSQWSCTHAVQDWWIVY